MALLYGRAGRLTAKNGGFRPGQIDAQTFTGAGSPAHHRFPVWWTGDGVPLMADVGAMTNEAVHDFRSYVHSDCGGHGSCNSIDPPHVPGQPPPPPPEDKPCETPVRPRTLVLLSLSFFVTPRSLRPFPTSERRPFVVRRRIRRCFGGPRTASSAPL